MSSDNSSNTTDNCSTSLERNGPTYGISFTRSQADKLFRQQLNMTINSFECSSTGYNNVIFFVDTVESTEGYVLKVGGRYWNKIKTEAEVKSLELLAQYTTIPVPKVLAYSSDRNNEFSVEWILMTRLPGTNMATVCENQELSVNAKKFIIRDLADYVAQMHFKMPRFNKIGALTMSGEIGTDLNKLGPWSTYEQFIRNRVRAEAIVLKEDSIFAPIRESTLDAIQRFEKLHFPTLSHLSFVFTHGDLDIQNILISIDDPESPRVTGIVDWEWSGSFPCSEEYFTSYSYFLDDDESIRTFFFDEFEKRNILTPRTIERFSLLQKLNQFQSNIAPWYMTDLVDPKHSMVDKELEKSRSIVQTVINDLEEELK